MADVENKNAPWLGGWIIAAGMGVVAFGVSKVVGSFDYTPAAFFGLIVFLGAGLVMGMPWGAGSRPANAMSEAPDMPDAHGHAAAEASPVAAVETVMAPVAAVPPAPAAVDAVQTTSAASDGPARLGAPHGGAADNLKEIEGIGPAMEKMLNGLGFWHFDQLAGWSDADVAVVDGELKGFKGRITRDKWVAQAKIIVTEGLEAFRERAKTNDY